MSSTKGSRFQAAIVIVTLALAMVGLLYFALNPLESRNSNTNTSAVDCVNYHTTYLIVANERGYNNSVDKGVPQNYWPILCAHQGDTVTIKVENTGSEPHGFAVGHYYEEGAALAEGKSITITFLADKTGSFSIFCTILCAVHPWMLSGLLVVT